MNRSVRAVGRSLNTDHCFSSPQEHPGDKPKQHHPKDDQTPFGEGGDIFARVESNSLKVDHGEAYSTKSYNLGFSSQLIIEIKLMKKPLHLIRCKNLLNPLNQL
jgi:hypothetical protein